MWRKTVLRVPAASWIIPNAPPQKQAHARFEKDCSNHAVSVTGNTATGCTCMCRRSAVLALRTSTPTKTAQHASQASWTIRNAPPQRQARARSKRTAATTRCETVTGNTATGCICMCRGQWTGVQCGACPARYDLAKDCAACASGFVDYPKCTPAGTGTCTVEKDCSNHAVSVTGNTPTGCTCTCTSRYDPATNCSSCSKGHAMYPQCVACFGYV